MLLSKRPKLTTKTTLKPLIEHYHCLCSFLTSTSSPDDDGGFSGTVTAQVSLPKLDTNPWIVKLLLHDNVHN